MNPFDECDSPPVSDEQLCSQAVAGQRAALEELLRRHQAWVFNLALRMLWDRREAEDATQEILVRLATRLSGFRAESRFRTWAYRLAVNQLLDARRSRAEEAVHDFGCYGRYLDGAPDSEPISPETPETRFLLEEARMACTLGLLLCLDREQRLVFVLGELFEASDVVGAELLGLTRENFRQRLARARVQLDGFLQEKCSLVEPSRPCRCARKTRAFIRDGIVDPANLRFAREHVLRVRDAAPGIGRSLSQAGELLRDQPFLEPTDFTARLRELLTLERPETLA